MNSRWLRPVALASLLLLTAILQNVLAQMWPPAGLIDGLMIVCGLVALRLPFRRAVLVGAAAGLIQDGLSGGLIGVHGFSKTAVVAMLAAASNLLMVRGQLAEALVVGLAATAEVLTTRLLLAFVGWPVHESLRLAPARGVATALTCGLLLVGVPRAVMAWKRRRSRTRWGFR